jgi:hypothetical protein
MTSCFQTDFQKEETETKKDICVVIITAKKQKPRSRSMNYLHTLFQAVYGGVVQKNPSGIPLHEKKELSNKKIPQNAIL